MENQPKFCRYCGNLLGMYPTKRFNEHSGKWVLEPYCTNPKCENHCRVVVERIRGKAWKLQNWEKCQRCV